MTEDGQPAREKARVQPWEQRPKCGGVCTRAAVTRSASCLTARRSRFVHGCERQWCAVCAGLTDVPRVYSRSSRSKARTSSTRSQHRSMSHDARAAASMHADRRRPVVPHRPRTSSHPASSRWKSRCLRLRFKPAYTIETGLLDSSQSTAGGGHREGPSSWHSLRRVAAVLLG